MKAIKNIAIIGSGNMAYFLANLFHSNQIFICQIISRNEETGRILANTFNALYSKDCDLLTEVDLVLIAVPDDQMSVCINSLPQTNALVCHCAGSISMNILAKFRNHGVLYPLQSVNSNYLENVIAPFLIEANSDNAKESLRTLIHHTGNREESVNSAERLKYHLAAVFANNFVNAMLMATEEIAQKNQLDFSLLLPLIQRTFEKLNSMGPKEAQTGPAKRHDEITINKHLELLKSDHELQDIYKHVSSYIQSKFQP